MYTHFFGSAVSVKIMDMFVIDHFGVGAEIFQENHVIMYCNSDRE